MRRSVQDLGCHCIFDVDENVGRVTTNNAAAPPAVAFEKEKAEKLPSRFQKFGIDPAECQRRFRLWTANLFFFPDYSELSDIVFEPCWVPEYVLRDGGTVAVHPELAALAPGFEPLLKSSQSGAPPRQAVSEGLTACPVPAEAVCLLWRPVFRVRYTYAWTPFVAFMAGGRAATTVSLHRPHVFF